MSDLDNKRRTEVRAKTFDNDKIIEVTIIPRLTRSSLLTVKTEDGRVLVRHRKRVTASDVEAKAYLLQSGELFG